MESIQITKYKCSICGELYDSANEAGKCESRPIKQDKGVKEGDTVLITQGDGSGQTGIVTKRKIIDKNWGHYAWERYWHTVAVDAKMGSGFHRFLTFDSYEPVKN